MKLKDKIKSYSFWVSLASAVVLILKVLGTRFGFTVDEGMLSDLFTAMCSVLVLLGIIVVPTNGNTTKINNINSIFNNDIKPQDNLSETTDNTIEPTTNIEINNNTEINKTENLSENSNEDFSNIYDDTTVQNCNCLAEENSSSNQGITYDNPTNAIEENITIDSNTNTQSEITTCLDDELMNENTNFDTTENKITSCSNPEAPIDFANSTSSEIQVNNINENDIISEANNLLTENTNENLLSELNQNLDDERNKLSDDMQEYILNLEAELQKLRNEQN